MKCAFCNRHLQAAAVFVGAMPIGPTCARKAGLLELARPSIGQRRLDPQTLDLFAEVEHG